MNAAENDVPAAPSEPFSVTTSHGATRSSASPKSLQTDTWPSRSTAPTVTTPSCPARLESSISRPWLPAAVISMAPLSTA